MPGAEANEHFISQEPPAFATFLVMFAAAAHAADDTEALIALDKQWGESIVKGDKTVSEKLLGDKVVSVDENGVMGKQAMLADIKAAPAGPHVADRRHVNDERQERQVTHR